MVHPHQKTLISFQPTYPTKLLLACTNQSEPGYLLYEENTDLSHQISITETSTSNPLEPEYVINIENNHLISKRYFVHCDNESLDRTQELIFPVSFPLFSAVVEAGMCNGIVCLGHNQELHAVLWNPSLRKVLRLNIPHTIDLSRVYTCVSRHHYSLIHGIGFDSCSNDYKFVSIAASHYVGWPILEKTKVLSVCVYSLNQGAWKAVNSGYVCQGDCIHFGGVNLNGVIHWLVVDTSGSVPVSILVFSLVDETFGEIPLPEGIDYSPGSSSSDYASLMTSPTLNGTWENIAYIHMNCYRSFINLWVMETYGEKESWRLVVSLGGERDGFKSIKNVRKNGEILVKLEGGRLASLNPRDMSLKVVSVKLRLLWRKHVEILLIVTGVYIV